MSCENVVQKVQEQKKEVTSLRDVTLEDIEHISNAVDKVDKQRALYVLNENLRVQQMIKALSNGNADEAGAILRSGHWAMSKEYEITTPELDHLVRSGETIAGIIGSRMMGGGFGGCTINLVKSETVEKSIAELLAAYKSKTGITAEYYHLDIDDGVALFKS